MTACRALWFIKAAHYRIISPVVSKLVSPALVALISDISFLSLISFMYKNWVLLVQMLNKPVNYVVLQTKPSVISTDACRTEQLIRKTETLCYFDRYVYDWAIETENGNTEPVSRKLCMTENIRKHLLAYKVLIMLSLCVKKWTCKFTKSHVPRGVRSTR